VGAARRRQAQPRAGVIEKRQKERDLRKVKKKKKMKNENEKA